MFVLSFREGFVSIGTRGSRRGPNVRPLNPVAPIPRAHLPHTKLTCGIQFRIESGPHKNEGFHLQGLDTQVSKP